MLDLLEEENRSVRRKTKPISFDRSLSRCMAEFAGLPPDRHAIQPGRACVRAGDLNGMCTVTVRRDMRIEVVSASAASPHHPPQKTIATDYLHAPGRGTAPTARGS